MRSKIAFLLLIGISSGFSIGDFAPTEVGNAWKYSYIYSLHGGLMWEYDTIKISIKIANKIADINHNKDTTVFLQITQNKHRIAGFGISTDFDSIVTEAFLDTAFIENDSIIKKNTFRCRVFPFWVHHNVSADSLQNVNIGGDIVKCVKFNSSDMHYSKGYCYVQNIGLSNYCDRSWGHDYGYSTDINLVTFDNCTSAGNIKNKVICPMNHTPRQNRSVLSISNNKILYNQAFDLKGRKMMGALDLPSGIFFNK